MNTQPKTRWAAAGAVLLAATLACSFGQGGRAERPERTPAPASAGGGSLVEVTLEEFDIRLDPDQPEAGAVTFVVTNAGHVPHDFRVRGDRLSEKTATIDAGDTEELAVTLAPGTYEYFCTVEGHAMLGMDGEFVVE